MMRDVNIKNGIISIKINNDNFSEFWFDIKLTPEQFQEYTKAIKRAYEIE